MGDHVSEEDGIITLLGHPPTMIAAHEDGMVILEVGDEDDAQAFIFAPDYAVQLGEALFRAGQEAKSNREQRERERG